LFKRTVEFALFLKKIFKRQKLKYFTSIKKTSRFYSLFKEIRIVKQKGIKFIGKESQYSLKLKITRAFILIQMWYCHNCIIGRERLASC